MDAAPAQVDAELPLRFAPAQSREQVQVDAALTQADMMVVRVVLVALLAALVVATRVVTVPVERRCQPGGEEQKGWCRPQETCQQQVAPIMLLAVVVVPQ